MPSITIWCESPIPSVNRPPLASCTVNACCAIVSGCRRVRRHDAGRQLDARHLAPDDAKHPHRVEREDLGERVAREPVRLGPSRLLDDVVDGAAGGVATEDPDAHAAPFAVPGDDSPSPDTTPTPAAPAGEKAGLV